VPRILFPFTSNVAPALAFQPSTGLFCLAWTDQQNVLRVAFSNDGGGNEWDEGRPVVVDFNTQPETSMARPAVAFFNNALYIAWTGTDNTVGPGIGTLSVAKCFEPGITNFTAKTVLWGETTPNPFGPALTVCPDLGGGEPTLVLAWTGSNGARTLNKRRSADGVTWPDEYKIIYWGWGSLDGPALAGTVEELLMAWTANGQNERLLCYSNITQQTIPGGPGSSIHVYNGDPHPGPAITYWGPSLAYDTSSGSTYLGFTSSGSDRSMLVLSQGGGDLSAPAFEDTLVDTSPFAPAICVRNDGSNPFLAWTATNGAQNLVFADYDSMPKAFSFPI
jgi:hypothetical protein